MVRPYNNKTTPQGIFMGMGTFNHIETITHGETIIHIKIIIYGETITHVGMFN
jgi:hypothetical protein